MLSPLLVSWKIRGRFLVQQLVGYEDCTAWMHFEYSLDGGPWTQFAEVKFAKAGLLRWYIVDFAIGYTTGAYRVRLRLEYDGYDYLTTPFTITTRAEVIAPGTVGAGVGGEVEATATTLPEADTVAEAIALDAIATSESEFVVSSSAGYVGEARKQEGLPVVAVAPGPVAMAETTSIAITEIIAPSGVGAHEAMSTADDGLIAAATCGGEEQARRI